MRDELECRVLRSNASNKLGEPVASAHHAEEACVKRTGDKKCFDLYVLFYNQTIVAIGQGSFWHPSIFSIV